MKSANQYREHAEELRVIAESSADRLNRKLLLSVAEDYERMARARDIIDQPERAN
jgi:hypothetical protein